MIQAVGADSVAAARKVQFGPLEPDAEDDQGSDSSSESEEEEPAPGFKKYRL